MFPFIMSDAVASRVGDLPLRPIPAIPAHLTLAAARKVAALKRIALLLVESEEQLVGILDERALAATADQVTVAAVMKPLELYLRPATTVTAARDLFLQTRAAILPVVAGGFVLGAITRGDIERAQPNRAPAEPRSRTA